MADSKGKKVWGIVRIANDFRYVFPWFYKLPWVAKAVATLSALVLLFVAVLKGMPWPFLMFCVVTVLFLIVLFVTAFIKPPLPEKQFQVELTPHGENSSEVYLEIWNTGDTVRISAQIGVLSRSDGRSVKKYAYDAFWTGPIYAKGHWSTSGPEQDHGKRTSAGIEKGRKDRIRIARMEPNRGDGMSEMTLIGIDESLMWDFEPSANSQLPFFTLTVNLFAEGFDNTVSKEYRIGPKAFIGPVEMVEVTR